MLRAVLATLLVLLAPVAADFFGDEDGVLTIEDLVLRYNFKCETYLVKTGDGYVLGLHRIISTDRTSVEKPPVLMMHDIEGGSVDFLINWPENSPALTLVDQGYDVWLGNNRGNFYSRAHVSMTEKDSAYWKFGPEDMGMQDLPTLIDFILAKRNLNQLEAYIGLGLGNTQFFMAASLNPQYFNQKVNLFIALAPTVQIHRTVS